MKIREAIRTMLFKEKATSKCQLYTQWGEQINPEHVLEEYPRPQLKRDHYINLNGYWNYCISKEELMPEHYDGQILVPFSPESALSGVNRQLKPDEILWYERILTIDQKDKEKRCILHFGAVDQYCEVYINHQKIGEHMGGYLPFSFDITKRLEEGTNLLSLKVTDLSDTSYHSRGKQKLKRGGMFYTAQSGIWQTVWLEWVPELYIKDIKITPLVDEGSVQVEIQINEDFDPKLVEEICFRVDVLKEQEILETTVSRFPFMKIPLKEFDYWSPEHPNLYQMVILAGKDRVESYFAMRKVEIKTDQNEIPRIYLNNEPYFQNGLLDQGYWPDGLYTAPSDEAYIFDIQKAKELGFNMLRKHIKIEPLRWYYHCDRLGMLVWQDIVNGGTKYNTFLVGYLPTLFPGIANRIKDKHYRWFGRKHEAGRKEWMKECQETVSHLYHFPSIVVWVPFNEGWGQFDSKEVYDMLHQLDTTRFIDHASGWYDQGCGDFKSKHSYFHSIKLSQDKRPNVLSEFGGYACYIKEHSYSQRIYGYRIYLTTETFDQAYHSLLEKEIQSLIAKGLSAAVYTQLTDVEDEVNGLLTYDRKVCKVTPINLK